MLRDNPQVTRHRLLRAAIHLRGRTIEIENAQERMSVESRKFFSKFSLDAGGNRFAIQNPVLGHREEIERLSGDAAASELAAAGELFRHMPGH